MHPDVVRALTAERVRDQIATAQRSNLVKQAHHSARQPIARRVWRRPRHAPQPSRA